MADTPSVRGGVIGFFARPDHPASYGPHGYVCLVVICEDWDEWRAVVAHLSKAFPRAFEGGKSIFNGVWYGGPYEPVFACEGLVRIGSEIAYRGILSCPINTFFSYGDNRAFAYLTGEEVLAS